MALLSELARRALPRAGDVVRLHEALLFIRAYPDDARVLRQAAAMLSGFADRADLRRHRRALAGSGIAGTTLAFRFYWDQARWVAARWGASLSIDWEEFEDPALLESFLHVLAHYAETPGLDEGSLELRDSLNLMKGAEETDAYFLVRRFEELQMQGLTREALYDEIDPPLLLAAGAGTPARTREIHRGSAVAFRTRPLDRAPIRARDEALRPPAAYRIAGRAEARRLIELARSAMVTRSRALDAFCHAEPRDVRVVSGGDGLEIAVIGVAPIRRLLLEALYGYVALQNGVIIGYGTGSALFGSVEMAYNVFDAFRGGEAGRAFGRILATFRQLFRADTFTIDPYQVGADNAEALRSGAWWFYQKMGFRPRERSVRRLMRREVARVRRNASYRSSIATLQRLSAQTLFLDLGKPRPDVLGEFPLGRIGRFVSGYMAGRFGADRLRGERSCIGEAARLLGLRSPPTSAGERLAWKRWSPLMLAIPGVARWPAADRLALARVALAKGSERESDFVALFDRHRRLRRALIRLAKSEEQP